LSVEGKPHTPQTQEIGDSGDDEDLKRGGASGPMDRIELRILGDENFRLKGRFTTAASTMFRMQRFTRASNDYVFRG